MAAPRNHAAERAKYMAIPICEEDIAEVSGNAPSYLKEAALRWYILLNGPPGFIGFGKDTREQVRVKEVWLEPSVDDSERLAVKLVTELEVTPGMCNAQGILEQGCMCALMDEGSAIALLLMKLTEGAEDAINVSQTFNMQFYHPAPSIGAKLKMVNRSVSTDHYGGCCNSEIWNIDLHRRVASGTQVQMAPSGR